MALGSVGKMLGTVLKKAPRTKKEKLGISAGRVKKSPQRESVAKAKKAERGVQPAKVKALEKRLLPSTPARKTAIDKMSSEDIAKKFTGKEISAMQRKFKDPKVLRKLKQAREQRKDLAESLDDMAIPRTKKRSLGMQFKKGGGQVKGSLPSRARPKGVGAAQRGWGKTGRH